MIFVKGILTIDQSKKNNDYIKLFMILNK